VGEWEKWRNKKRRYIGRKRGRKNIRKPRINLEATNKNNERNKYQTVDERKEGMEKKQMNIGST